MGLTFCVAPDVMSLVVDARWGRYERVPNDEHHETKKRKTRATGTEEEVKVKVWRRVPCGGRRGAEPVRTRRGVHHRLGCPA